MLLPRSGAVQAFVFSDPVAEVFHQFRFGWDHGARLILQSSKGFAEDLYKRTIMVAHAGNFLQQLSFLVSKSIMPAVVN